MEIQCIECKNTYDNSLLNCPYCGRPTSSQVPSETVQKIRKIVLINTILIFIVGSLIILGEGYIISRYDGYYNYDDTIYYKDGTRWYYYEEGLWNTTSKDGIDWTYYEVDSWERTKAPLLFDKNNRDPYYMGRKYSDAKALNETKDFSDVTNSKIYRYNHRHHYR